MMQRADLQYRGDGPARRNRTHDASLAPGRTVTATENSRTTGDFEGVETRKLSYNLDGGDTTWTVNGPIFYRDDVVVNALGGFRRRGRLRIGRPLPVHSEEPA
jgi:hypothetical protein